MSEEQNSNLILESPQSDFGVNKDRLTRGSSELDTLLNFMDRKLKRELLDENTTTDNFAAVFIGIKPAFPFSSDVEKKVALCIQQEIDSGNISDDYVVSNDLFYSKSYVQTTIDNNNEVFSDYNKDTDLDSYLQSFLNLGTGQPENTTKKVGLIFGYPSDAAEAFSRYQPYYKQFNEYVIQHKSSDPLLEEYHFDVTNPEEADMKKCNQSRDEHRDEIRERLDQIDEFRSLPYEAKDYIADMRGIITRGYSFAIPATSPLYKTFAASIENNFKQSEVDQVIAKHREIVDTPDYDQDFEVAVEGIASAMESEIIGYLSWNLIKEDKKPENLFKDIEEEIESSLNMARQKAPSLKHDLFETDLKSGIIKIRDAIDKATKKQDGYFTLKWSNKKYSQFENWATQNLLFLLSKGGVNTKPVVKKFSKNPDASVADICKEFFKKSE